MQDNSSDKDETLELQFENDPNIVEVSRTLPEHTLSQYRQLWMSAM